MDYETLVNPEHLFAAFDEFKRGKRSKADVMEVERNLEDNIFVLSHDLVSKQYRHGPYTMFHVWDPKFRIINKASVRDRVVHHVLFKYLESLFDRTFIYHSYSSRTGKGIHLGFKALYQMMRTASKDFKQFTYALKCDVSQFFANVDHAILYLLIARRVREQNVLWLIREVITSFQSERESKCGIPLGNVTSQIFANIYLGELDQFVKHTLKVSYYVRYADDFIILHADKEHLVALIKQIDTFLVNHLHLQLHPRKVSIRKFRQGVDFLGAICLPYHMVLRTKTKRRIFQKLQKAAKKVKCGEFRQDQFNQSLQSYLGLLKHVNGFETAQKIKRFLFKSQKIFGHDKSFLSKE